MRVHELKTWPGPFAAVVEGRKTFEVRKNDRGFAAGDELVLVEWDPSAMSWSWSIPGASTGRRFRVRVTYILDGGRFDLPAHICVMAIVPVAADARARCRVSTLRELARDALEELRRTQFVTVERQAIETLRTWTETSCTSCGAVFLYDRHAAVGGHLCARSLLIADIDAALRKEPA